MKKINIVDDQNLEEVAGGMDTAEREALIQARLGTTRVKNAIHTTTVVHALTTLTGPKLHVTSGEAMVAALRAERRKSIGTIGDPDIGN